MIRTAVLAVALLLLSACGEKVTRGGKDGIPEQHARFTEETVRLAATLPIQDEGRVKPLSTFARYSLIAIRGLAGCYNLDEVRISPTEWLLDSMFHPEVAKHYQIFLVQDDNILTSIGVKVPDRKRRDRYSFHELREGRAEISRLASMYRELSASEIEGQKEQVLNLDHNLRMFEVILGSMDFAREEYPAKATPGLAKLFRAVARPGFGAVIERLGKLAEMRADLTAGGGGPNPDERRRNLMAIARLENALVAGARYGSFLAILPPTKPVNVEEEWYAPGDVLSQVNLPRMPAGKAAIAKHLEVQIALIEDLEGLARASDDPDIFQERLVLFHGSVEKLATARGEYEKIGLEDFYYRVDPFSYALYGFILAFVVLAGTWVLPRQRWLMVTAWGLLSVATLLTVGGIVLRCVIRSRPPVTTLYETVVFITAIAVLAAMVVEYMSRRRIAVVMAALLGAAGLFLAQKYEFHKKVDTMPTLVAVLDTNFWLSVHVTTIAIGYAGGLLAAVIGNVYILGRLFGLKSDDPLLYRSLARSIYGITCFGLLFSVVGTLTGGIWANESWGRFWGWDPKENGALLICIWMTVMIHLKLGRYVRDLGLSIAAIFGGLVVVFSWWGVNLLGVGLHSYGFTSGILWILISVAYLQVGVMYLGLVVWTLNRFLPTELPKAGEPPTEPDLTS